MDNQIVNTMQIKEEFNRLISLAYDKGRVDGYEQGRADGLRIGLAEHINFKEFEKEIRTDERKKAINEFYNNLADALS